MKGIDANLLVYASLVDHPAMAACDAYIAANPPWICNIANLVEMRHVLATAYGLSATDADAKFTDFLDSLTVDPLTGMIAEGALPLCQAHGIDFNDAVLLETCRVRGVTTLATDDRRLAAACRAMGITPENPINDALRASMAQWEDENLPAKGLPRLLFQVHRWIDARNPTLAADFHNATQALSRPV